MQKLHAGHTGYHIAKDVVLTEDIVFALDNLARTVVSDQGHVEQLTATILQLT